MQIGFVGAGRVGVSLGKYFTSKGRKVAGYYSLSPESTAWAADFTNTKQHHSLEELMGSSDMVFFTVPDDEIESVWLKAREFATPQDGDPPLGRPKRVVAHCSGIHSSHIFSDSRRHGFAAYSIHPLCAVSSREESWRGLGDALFTIEGDESRLTDVTDFFQGLGNRTRVIGAEDKPKYHAAASLASNHMTAVFALAQKLLMDCGFSEGESREELFALAAGNLANIRRQGCAPSLTGPIERGDARTVQLHLSKLNQEERKVYLANAAILLEIARQKNPDRDYSRMSAALCDMEGI